MEGQKYVDGNEDAAFDGETATESEGDDESAAGERADTERAADERAGTVADGERAGKEPVLPSEEQIPL